MSKHNSERLTRTDQDLAVVGLGYVGLPLSVDLVEAGYRVHAIDVSRTRVDCLRAGQSYIDDVSNQRIKTALATGRLHITTNADTWGPSSVAFICVPTPVTRSRQPDLSAILAAGAYVREGLNQGDLIVLQSTTYPGTTLGPLRRVLEGSGLRAGTDFALAFAPERVSPGDQRPASTIPRLVGGIDKSSTERAALILDRISPSVMRMSSPDAAELAKLFENVFRNVNIALVNELALICERLGLDVWEVIEGASTKPFGFMPFYPGPGVGGHCIPVDPYYLAARAREVAFDERFIETAGDINSQMPEHVVGLVQHALNAREKPLRGANILVLGVAFKADVSDSRNSPAAPIISALVAAGADVRYHDPYVPRFDPVAEHDFLDGSGVVLGSANLMESLAEGPDCVVVVTAHRTIDWDLVFARAELVVDTRNVSRDRSSRPGQVLRLGAGWN